ncbi:MAG: hypothetical protein IT439_12385 [Phycisphaerales bacterium]|nr:hypothetical protein [Phycisphaerales bacterium]
MTQPSRFLRAALLFWLLAALLPGVAGAQTGAVPAERQANNVAVITIRTGDKPIDSVVARSVARRIRAAEKGGADALVFDIDTPGGEVGAILDICTAIKESGVKNTVAWINSKALSGGAIISLACREIIVSDTVTWGDAMPIAAGPGGVAAMPDELKPKFLAPLISEVVDSARRRNQQGYVYDELLVQAILALDVQLWRVRHKTTGQEICITAAEYERIFGREPDYSNPRVPSLNPGQAHASRRPRPPAPGGSDPAMSVPAASPALAEVAGEATKTQNLPTTRPTITADDRDKWELVEFVTDGSAPLTLKAPDMHALHLAANPDTRPIRSDDDLRAWFGAAHIKRLDPLWSEGLVQVMTSMWVRGVLIVILLIAVFLEMVSPSGLAGAVAALALALLLIPPYLMGLANWWEIVAIFAGLGLVLLEIFVLPGFGVAGISGMVLLFGGLLGTFIGGDQLFPTDAKGQSDMLYGLTTIILALGTASVGWWLIVRHFGSIPLLNKLVMKEGEDAHEGLLEAMAAPAPAAPVRAGDVGRVVTPLRPGGRAEFAGRVIDVVADSGYIDAGQLVRVEEASAFRILVSHAGPEGPEATA